MYLQNLAAEKTYNNLDVTIEQALKNRREVRQKVPSDLSNSALVLLEALNISGHM